MAVLLAHQAVANPNTVVGTPLDVDRYEVEAYVECYHGFDEVIANTNRQSFVIQTSLKKSGNDDWLERVKFTVFSGTPVTQVCTANEAVGDKTIEIAATASFAAEDLIYIRDTVATDSEWAYVQEIILNTSVVLVDGLTTAHALTTTSLFTNAEKFAAQFNVEAAQRIRGVYFNEGAAAAAADTHIQADISLITGRG